jgi:hypothetical protein
MTGSASKAARHRRVSLYRSYRDGELPDIESLSPRDLLRPLQHLALLDGAIAREVRA